jgi:uncharacterized coiled-coil protein SlyX
MSTDTPPSTSQPTVEPERSVAFEPAPPPVSVDLASSTPADTAVQADPPVDPPAPIAAPASAPSPMLPAQTQRDIDAVVAAALDAAELASQGAQAAVAAGVDLKMATQQMRQMHRLGYQEAKWLLFTASGVMGLALVFFLISGVRLNSRVNQLDATLQAVGKRAADMRMGLEGLEGMQSSLAALGQEVERLTRAQGELQAGVQQAIQQSEAMAQKVPNQTAQQVAAASSGQLTKQLQGLETRLQAQSTALQGFGRELNALKTSVGQVDRMSRDVQTLVSLQKEQTQAAQQQAVAAPPPRPPAPPPLQYPRPRPSSLDTERNP